MFNWMKRKASSQHFAYLSQLIAQMNPSWLDTQNYSVLAREGYMKNVVVYHCIKSIAESASDIPIVVKVNDSEEGKAAQEIRDLLIRPNPRQSYKTFIRMAASYKLISGNTYILSNIASTRRFMELTLLRPDRVRIETNTYSIPIRYIYEINGHKDIYPIDPDTFLSDVLHIKEFHPLDDLYGFSPIAAAARAIKQNNEASEWNQRTLENSGRPPGILSLKDKGDYAPPPTKEQIDSISESIFQRFQEWGTHGRIPVVGSEMNWLALGMSSTQIDWINGKSSTARDICNAFRYPPFLLGMPEGATYNNVSEAKLALYEEAVIPIAQSILAELAYYIGIQKNVDLTIELDLDQVPALMPRRQIARQSARDDVLAGIFTVNEARDEQGYDPVEGGDEVMVPAGKLPINFDTGTLPAPKYHAYLLREGFSSDEAIALTKLAFEKV